MIQVTVDHFNSINNAALASKSFQPRHGALITTICVSASRRRIRVGVIPLQAAAPPTPPQTPTPPLSTAGGTLVPDRPQANRDPPTSLPTRRLARIPQQPHPGRRGVLGDSELPCRPPHPQRARGQHHSSGSAPALRGSGKYWLQPHDPHCRGPCGSSEFLRVSHGHDNAQGSLVVPCRTRTTTRDGPH
jgi:hypothetical protein